MRRPLDLVVTAVAAVTPLGLNAVQTAAALRAGLGRLQAHPFFVPRLPDEPSGAPEPAISGWVDHGEVGAPLEERLTALASLAFHELVQAGRLSRAELASAPLLAALPLAAAAGRPGLKDPEAFLARLLNAMGVRTAVRPPVRDGPTGALELLQEAAARLASGACRACVLLEVDSLLDDATLSWVDGAERLKSERNRDGFVPGEAASLVLLETAAGARARGATPLLRVSGVGLARESQPLPGERWSTAQGLCAAVGDALAQVGPARPHFTLCDLNGESYRAQGWGVACARLGEPLAREQALWHPADAVGDVGAATGTLLLTVAARAFARGYAPAERALLFCGADDGRRAACVVEPPEQRARAAG